MKKSNKLLTAVVSIMLVFSPCYVDANELSTVIENNEEEVTTGGNEETEDNKENNTENKEEENKEETEKEEEKPPQVEYKISLNKTEISLDTGKSEVLTVTTTPNDSKVKWTSNNEKVATVDQNGKVTAGSEAGKATITATIDGTEAKATCEVSVSRTVSKDATLKDLNISNGTLDQTFKSDILEYKVTIDSTVKSLKFKDLENDLNDSKAGYLVTGNEKLKDGDIVSILITAEDGTTQKTYKLTIVKDTVNLNLKSLKINGYALNEVFNADTLEYTASIPYEIEIITIQAAAEDADASVKVTGATDLKVGENTVKVTVSDDSGNSKVYQIIVTREKEVTVEEKPTSIITSEMINEGDNNSTSDKTDQNNTNTNNSDDNFLKYAIVSLACLILFGIGGIGIYFYLKTSPKKLKKELEINPNIENESPIIETPVVEEKQDYNGNIESIMDEKLVETREFNKEDIIEKTEDLFDDE